MFNNEEGLIPYDRPKFPQYSYVSKRTESFKKWPEYLPVDPQSLVEAGLVYTGVGDSVRCYYCGGGLRGWERDDNPWVEHAKFYSSCPHVRLIKGDKWIEDVCKGNDPDCGEDESDENSDEDFISKPAAQSLIQMGYERKDVQNAIETFIKLHNRTNFTGLNLCEIIDKDNHGEETTEQNPIETTTVVEEEEETDEDDENEEQSSSTYDDRDYQALLTENRRLKESKICKICLDKMCDVAFLPCGHLCTCPECAPQLFNCPICRSKIKGYTKVYFA